MLKWWQREVFYQIYPRSFADANGDGIGDLNGILGKLDYLRRLGIGAIWLCPHYPSPNVDWGYDVADYMAVAPEYGTLEDFRLLVRQAHARGIRVLVDLVLNHTSDRHPWFLESRSDRSNPKRNWYVWRDPGPDGGPPNNWRSVFGGSAWEFDPATGQYYYHYFFKEQPDLNWRNPEVQEAMWEVVRFWLSLGVDGFRLDAISTIYEHPDMPPAEIRLSDLEILRAWRENLPPEQMRELAQALAQTFRHQNAQPEVHVLMKALRALVDTYPGDRVLIGEDHDISYYGNGQDELHLVFNFPLMHTNRIRPAFVRANQAERLAQLPPGAWPCNTLNNHDSSRVRSAFGDGEHDEAIARLNAALLLTLKGTPVLYYGEEIGMTDLLLQDVEQLRDTQAIVLYRTAVACGCDPEWARTLAIRTSRDRCRTPMQWANAPNAGFSPPGVETWLPVNPNYAQGINVADQEQDPNSMLHYYRRLIRLRQRTPALYGGDYEPLGDSEACLTFLRRDAVSGQTCWITFNMSSEEVCAPLPRGRSVRRLFCEKEVLQRPREIVLKPFAVFIGELS